MVRKRAGTGMERVRRGGDAGAMLLLLMLNESKTPAEIISPRFENGTHTAMTVMEMPETAVPHTSVFRLFVRAKIPGRRPSWAMAKKSCGCARKAIRTTTGRVINSPAWVIATAHGYLVKGGVVVGERERYQVNIIADPEIYLSTSRY